MEPERSMNLAPAGGVRALQIQAVFSRREIGRYEAAEMREVCRGEGRREGGGHECVAPPAPARHKSIRLVWWSNSLYNTQDKGQS